MIGLLGRVGLIGVRKIASVTPTTPEVFTADTSSPWNTISADGLTVTKNGNDGVYTAAICSKFVTSGQWYWELEVTGLVGDAVCGIGNPSTSLADNDYLGINANSFGWFHNSDTDGGSIENNTSTQSNIDGFAQGDRLCFALDADLHKWWARRNDLAWLRLTGGTQDPATGAGGFDLDAALYTTGIAPAVVTTSTGDIWTGKFAASSWLYTNPTGFNSLDDAR